MAYTVRLDPRAERELDQLPITQALTFRADIKTVYSSPTEILRRGVYLERSRRAPRGNLRLGNIKQRQAMKFA